MFSHLGRRPDPLAPLGIPGAGRNPPRGPATNHGRGRRCPDPRRRPLAEGGTGAIRRPPRRLAPRSPHRPRHRSPLQRRTPRRPPAENAPHPRGARSGARPGGEPLRRLTRGKVPILSARRNLALGLLDRPVDVGIRPPFGAEPGGPVVGVGQWNRDSPLTPPTKPPHARSRERPCSPRSPSGSPGDSPRVGCRWRSTSASDWSSVRPSVRRAHRTRWSR